MYPVNPTTYVGCKVSKDRGLCGIYSEPICPSHIQADRLSVDEFQVGLCLIVSVRRLCLTAVISTCINVNFLSVIIHIISKEINPNDTVWHILIPVGE